MGRLGRWPLRVRTNVRMWLLGFLLMGSGGRVHTGGRRRAQLILHTQLQKLQWRHDKRYDHVKHTAHSPKSLIVHKMFRCLDDDEAEIMRLRCKVELFWLVNAYLQETENGY